MINRLTGGFTKYKDKRIAVTAEAALNHYLSSLQPLRTCGFMIVATTAGIVLSASAHRDLPIQLIAYAAFNVSSLIFGRFRLLTVALGTLSIRSAVLVTSWYAVAVMVYTTLARALYGLVCTGIATGQCTPHFIGLSFLSIGLAPYVETIISNGIAQTFAYRISKRLSIVVGTAVFVLPHFSINFFIVANGLAFAVIRQRYRSLGVIILCHSLSNLCQAYF